MKAVGAGTEQRMRIRSFLRAGAHSSGDGPCPQAGELHTLHHQESVLSRTPSYSCSLLMLGMDTQERSQGSRMPGSTPASK